MGLETQNVVYNRPFVLKSNLYINFFFFRSRNRSTYSANTHLYHK